MTTLLSPRIRISVASLGERQAVYRLRHDVYSSELRQYGKRPHGSLPDAADVDSLYIIASIGDDLVGFVGITSRDSPCLSVEKHLSRDLIPMALDEHTFEIRALTVKESRRGGYVAAGLMYAAFRWVEAHGGKRIVCIGRREVLDMYLRFGLKRLDRAVRCGDVTYDLMGAEVGDVASRLRRSRSQVDRVERRLDWKLDIAFHSPGECYHGGAFFDAVGVQFDHMDRVESVINADVLDAWFPPAPAAQDALRCQLPWIMRTSPPTRAEGLTSTIAEVRGVDSNCILTGGGSSELIFRAFCYWLHPSSSVLILDPTYGEYSHVLEQIVRCQTTRVTLDRRDGYQIDLASLEAQLARGFDLFVWVNPNSPTGLHVARADVEALLRRSATHCKRIWVDETYVEYAGREQSLEPFAAQSENTIVCKSMSKVYALSGMRVAYLCASPHQLERLRVLTPPWSVGLPAQIAATHALRADDYYSMRYEQTHELRMDLARGLHQLGIAEVVPGIGNFVMFHLPEAGRNAAYVVKECRARGLFLRDVSGMGSAVGEYAIRMAVKDNKTNRRMLRILEEVLSDEVGVVSNRH